MYVPMWPLSRPSPLDYSGVFSTTWTDSWTESSIPKSRMPPSSCGIPTSWAWSTCGVWFCVQTSRSRVLASKFSNNSTPTWIPDSSAARESSTPISSISVSNFWLRATPRYGQQPSQWHPVGSVSFNQCKYQMECLVLCSMYCRRLQLQY